MPTSTVKYLGNLRTECTHLQSGTIIITDAPVDNQGKGEAFSPTDKMATSLASCMLTIMGIASEIHSFSMKGAYAEVTKIMNDNPRMIKEIKIDLFFPENNFSDKVKKVLEIISKTCPVALSLKSELNQNVNIHF